MEDITQDVQEFASKLFDFARHGDAAGAEVVAALDELGEFRVAEQTLQLSLLRRRRRRRGCG